MTAYWTKERFKDIVIALVSMYIMLFVFFVFICWINNDLSQTNVIYSAQMALFMNLFAMCVGGLGAFMKMGDKND